MRFLAVLLLISCATFWGWTTSLARGADVYVLMHDSGRVEYYDSAEGAHLGTFISGLPAANAILFDSTGRLLIATGEPGKVGTVLRFDPRGSGRIETLLDVPEGYGGRLFQATGMAWYEGDLLVASKGDGKVKRYDGETGQWEADVALAAPGGLQQIAVHERRLVVTDSVAQALRRAPEQLNGSMSEIWTQLSGHSPGGLALDAAGRAYWSSSTNRIFRFDGQANVEWAGALGSNQTPTALSLGPDGHLYVAHRTGQVTVWRTDAPNSSGPLQTLGGSEMSTPVSIAFSSRPRTGEFVYAAPIDPQAESTEKIAYFETQIRPLLHAHCLDCHGESVQEGGLRLDSRQGWQRGGETGPAIAPGNPEESLLVQAVQYLDKDLQMPPDEPLPVEDRQRLVDWVRQGAIDPRNEATQANQPHTAEWAEQFQQRLDWWSLKPLAEVQPPRVDDSRWSRHPVDRFIRHAQQQAGLTPAPAAEPEVLLRRLSLVLTGLPPTLAQRHRFLRDGQRDPSSAYASLVDDMLSSPHFGERFARHWMDAVRYTDTYGYEWDNPAKGAHEYRDYLIRAFNQDVGYDTLLREQIAGDLLVTPRLDTALGINESLIGPMFYHLGEHRHGSSLAFNGIHQEMINNKIDAFSKVFLATTVACARCHDHKLEAVSQRDYYALGAVLMTPRWVSRPVDAPDKYQGALKRLTGLRAAIHDELAAVWSRVELPPESWQPLLDSATTTVPNIEEVAYPIAKLHSAQGDIAQVWQTLATEWRESRAVRQRANEAYHVLLDGTRPDLPDGWVMEGDGIVQGWVPDGTPLIALQGDVAISRLLPSGYHTHALSSKLPGVLRMPPQHLVSGQFTSLRLAGGEYGGYLIKDANAFQNEGVGFLDRVVSSWQMFGDAVLKNGVTQVTIDFATASLNPNFPPRTGLAAKLPSHDLGYDKRSWVSITGIVTHDVAGAPQDVLETFTGLYDQPGPPLGTRAEADQRIRAWLQSAVRQWCQGEVREGEVRVLNAMLEHQLLPNRLEAGSRLAELVTEYRQVEAELDFPRTVNSMDERESTECGLHFNVRGNVDALGELVAPDFLQMFSGRNDVASCNGSGRLELAESLLDPTHPLTARVYVNRVWQWLFGAGLVTTPDDFGRLGDRPSHPELFDWLAGEFIRQRWSTKQLVRQLVLTETFRQSGNVTPQAREVDPANRLRHHYPTRRMEAELIRDAMLAVSGRLDHRLYGRPINPPRAVEDAAKRLFSGPLDGNGRRSLYLTMSIMDPPKFLKAFDLPDLKLPSGKRNVTNVPTQALLLLNDPFVISLAKAWARDVVQTPHASAAERIRQMFTTAFGREPLDEELQQWLAISREWSASTDTMLDEQAWAQLAHTFFNAKEFIYYR